jgi:Ca2+-binding RTX toxin-like protein
MHLSRRKTLAEFGLAATIASTACLAAPAEAATAASAKVVQEIVRFDAAKGQTNRLTITRSGRTVTLDDKVAIKAGKGCKAVKGDKTKVTCTAAGTTGEVQVTLADKNDTFTNKATIWADVDGGSGSDTLTGGSKSDSLDGGSGNDKLYGGAGDDSLMGGTGNDLLEGSSGDDNLNSDLGADIMKGGAGWDLVYYGSRTKPLTLDLDGVKGDDGEKGEKDTISAEVEELIGGAGKDTLTGNAKANAIYGQADNDVIRGGAGDDNCIVLRAGKTINCEQFGD